MFTFTSNRTVSSTEPSYSVRGSHDTVANTVVTAAGFITGQFLRPDGTPAASAHVYATNVDNLSEIIGTTAADGTYKLRV